MKKSLNMINMINDTLIFSEIPEQYEHHLRLVLQRLRDKKLFAKRSKCSFGETQVEYLGHFVGNGQRWIDKSTASTVEEWPVP